jgi:hypothetical protein
MGFTVSQTLTNEAVFPMLAWISPRAIAMARSLGL